jgi:fluoride exporter
MWRLSLVFFGSGFGGVLRYVLGSWVVSRYGAMFPYGTIAINLIGSFLIGLIMHVSTSTTWMHPDVRLALTAGVLGGFTTYSAFNHESLALFHRGAVLLGALNIVVTVVGSLGAGIVGLLLSRYIVLLTHR